MIRMGGAENRRGHAFISYVREDARQVDDIEQALRTAGIRVWRDTAELWPGEDWRAKIRSAISNDALAFIACFSRAGLSREKSYQNEELALAIDELRQRPPGKPWLIPVRLDDCDIPDLDIGGGRTLGSIQRADLFGAEAEAGRARLVTVVKRILRQPTADQGPADGRVNQPPPAGQPPPPGGPSGRDRRRKLAGLSVAVLALVGVGALVYVLQDGHSYTPVAPPPSARPISPRTSPDASPHPTPSISHPPLSNPLILHNPGGSGVYGIAYTRTGTLVTGDFNGSVYLWNVAENENTQVYSDANGWSIFGVAVSPDGKTIAAVTFNQPAYTKGSVVLWRTSSDKPIATLTAPDGSGFGNPPAFSPDGGTVAAASDDDYIYFWSTANGRSVGTRLTDPGTQGVYGIAYSPATGFLASADYNGTAYLWDTKQAEIVREFTDPARTKVVSVAFSANGGILATGDYQGNVDLWNAGTGTRMIAMHVPEGGSIQSLAFSPRGGMVAATADNLSTHTFVTCVWDLTGKLIATFRDKDPSSEGVTKVAFSPDGGSLAVGDENANTYIWNVGSKAG
jgi:hypothetical protein